jgi:hypothetical protein
MQINVCETVKNDIIISVEGYCSCYKHLWVFTLNVKTGSFSYSAPQHNCVTISYVYFCDFEFAL